MFECEELIGEVNWILFIFLILGSRHDSFALLHDVGDHFVDDEFDGCVDSIEYIIHQFELIKLLRFKHELAACTLLVRQRLSLVFDGLFEHYVYDSRLRLLLKEEVGVVLLFKEMVCYFLDVLIATEFVKILV